MVVGWSEGVRVKDRGYGLMNYLYVVECVMD
jgi:hypothetical protein